MFAYKNEKCLGLKFKSAEVKGLTHMRNQGMFNNCHKIFFN